MKTTIYCATLALLVVFSFFLGCSSVSTTPDLIPASSTTYLERPSGENILGFFEVILDTDKMEISLEPVRERTLSDCCDSFFDVEITVFMRGDFTRPTMKNLRAVDDSANGDLTPDLAFDLSIEHPFKRFDPAKPPSGSNRADLDLFSPMVYILNAGNQNASTPPGNESGKVVDTGLPHPDGGTISGNFSFVQDPDGWSNGADGIPVDASDGISADELLEILNYNDPPDFPGTDVHPFFLFFDGDAPDGGTDNPTPNDRRMSQGEAPDTRTIQLNIGPGEGTIKFALAVTGAYGNPAQGKANRVPDLCRYFPKAHDTAKAIINNVRITPPDPNTPTDGLIEVEVLDRQAGATGVAGTMEEYRAQPDGGTLLAPEITDYSDPLSPVTTGLTMADYLIGDTGSMMYRIVDPDGVEIIALTTISGSDIMGSGTPTDPYVFNAILDYNLFSDTIPYYTVYILISSGTPGASSKVKLTLVIKVNRIEMA